MITSVNTEVRCVWQAGALLGEGCWWSTGEQALYWVDIKNPAILRYSPSQDSKTRWPSPEMVGCFAAREHGGFIGGFQSGLCIFELEEPGKPIRLNEVIRPVGHRDTDRFNDGKCHPDGTFWAGTMDNAECDVRGHFYRLSIDGNMEHVSGPHMVCNGPAFSPDGRLAYLTDSARRIVYRIDLHSDERRPQPFVSFDESDGYPDGMTTDDEGRLWIAFWDGWKVRCLAPSGERLAEIHLPVSRPTSCAFGGNDLNTLFVTSARIGLDPSQLASQPLAGGLFACSFDGASGLPAPLFGG